MLGNRLIDQFNFPLKTIPIRTQINNCCCFHWHNSQNLAKNPQQYQIHSAMWNILTTLRWIPLFGCNGDATNLTWQTKRAYAKERRKKRSVRVVKTLCRKCENCFAIQNDTWLSRKAKSVSMNTVNIVNSVKISFSHNAYRRYSPTFFTSFVLRLCHLGYNSINSQ